MEEQAGVVKWKSVFPMLQIPGTPGRTTAAAELLAAKPEE